MTTARDIMTGGADFLDSSATVLDAAKKLASEDYGALPVCDGEKLQGMVTDRDLVVKVMAQGKDPGQVRLSDLVSDQQQVVTIGADDSLEEVTRTMSEHQVRRLPVIDGDRLVGMVSQADLARSGADQKTADAVEAISQ